MADALDCSAARPSQSEGPWEGGAHTKETEKAGRCQDHTPQAGAPRGLGPHLQTNRAAALPRARASEPGAAHVSIGEPPFFCAERLLSEVILG